jgi:hypothetical protein
MYQQFLIKGPQKFTHFGIFGLKINHLATLFKSKKKTLGKVLKYLT